MRFRNFALLAIIATVVPFVYNVISFYLLVRTTHSYSQIAFFSVISSLLPELSLALFFFFVYAEALGQIKAETRAKAAVVSTILMGLDAARNLFRLVAYALALLITPSLINPHDSVLLANGFFQLGSSVLFIVFLIAFTTNKRILASRVIPRVAGVLGIFTVFQSVWSSVQIHNSSFALGWASYAVGVCGWVGFLVFYIVVWRRWQPDLSIHENVVS